MIIASLPSRKQQICSLKTKITLIKLIHCLLVHHRNQNNQINQDASAMFFKTMITLIKLIIV